MSSSSILFELRFLKTERSQSSFHDATSWILIGIFLERIGLQSQILSWFPCFEVTESINCSIHAWDGYMIKQSIFPITNAPPNLHPPKSNSLGGGVADKKYDTKSDHCIVIISPITLRNIIDPQKYHMTVRDYLNSNLIFAIISLNIKIPKVRFFLVSGGHFVPQSHQSSYMFKGCFVKHG